MSDFFVIILITLIIGKLSVTFLFILSSVVFHQTWMLLVVSWRNSCLQKTYLQGIQDSDKLSVTFLFILSSVVFHQTWMLLVVSWRNSCLQKTYLQGIQDSDRKAKTYELNTLLSSKCPAKIYLLKVNNRNMRKRCEICSKLT